MEKIKAFIESEKGKDILIVIIVILVGLGSFELGRLSNEGGSAGLKIEYPAGDSSTTLNQPANVISAMSDVGRPNSSSGRPMSDSSGKNFFASSKGKKYYTLGCAAGKSIKMENRIYFATGAEAEQAGYTLSSSCN